MSLPQRRGAGTRLRAVRGNNNWKEMESVTLCVYDRAGACGGPFAWAVAFSAYLHRSGSAVQVMILCPGGRPNSMIAEACEHGGVPTVILDTDGACYLEDQTEWILREWAKQPSSVFIANLVLPALFATRWIRRAGGKTIGVMHSTPEHDPFYRDIIRQFVAGKPEWHLDAVVPVSDHIAQIVRDAAPANMMVTTIPCGTALSDLSAVPPASGLRLLYCGRLVQEAKRIREVTEALLALCRQEGVSATICGDGEERAWLEERLAGQDKVCYAGHLPPHKVPALMAEHHVIVLLSDYEGLSMALVEGMACGLVPICLDEPSGTRELIRDGMNGLIVNDRDTDFLRAVGAICDQKVWGRMSEEARHTVETRYSQPVLFEKWLSMIQELAAGGSLNERRLPRHVNLRGVQRLGGFVNYAPCRPPRREKLLGPFRSIVDKLRATLRPRARLRAMAASAGRLFSSSFKLPPGTK